MTYETDPFFANFIDDLLLNKINALMEKIRLNAGVMEGVCTATHFLQQRRHR